MIWKPNDNLIVRCYADHIPSESSSARVKQKQVINNQTKHFILKFLIQNRFISILYPTNSQVAFYEIYFHRPWNTAGMRSGLFMLH